MKTNIVYNKDCLEGMSRLPSKSVNLVIADPPYNIGKAHWDKIPDYIEWLGIRLLECQRVLRDNGSFYLFHNDFLQMVEIQNWINENSKFIFKRLIIWNKRYEGSSRKWYFDNVIQSNIDRNYRLMAEYLLFYTFQDGTGLDTIKSNKNLFESIKQYLRDEKNKSKMTLTDLNCREYEDLRYIFNNQKTHHSVWNFEIAKKNGHITPKPIPLIENILKHSSNKGDIVLIPFIGSGNDCIACQNLGRHFIAYEINKKYCQIAQQRLEAEKTLWD